MNDSNSVESNEVDMFALNGILQKIYFHFIEEKYDGNKYYHYKIKITDADVF